ncbi:MAG: DUF1080 domain-containing protein [Kiritimatiellaeota bacterium]|nr:DUF1080 domain-containing protein [Kiritimatiellota bacterium]
MKQIKMIAAAMVAGTSAATALAGLYGDTPDARHAWAVHDNNRPQPPIIQAEPDKPPSDAIVLFDGTSLDQWCADKGEPTKWVLKDGAMECVRGSGYIRTKQSFGDCQLHVEWATPTKVEGGGQGRGNSGVFLMGQHEVQVLDNYDNPTYPDGQAASVYAENPPLVNACRKPGEWQTYDIIFHQPVWEGDVMKFPGSVTVLHNGVLVQDHWELEGLSTHCTRRPITKYADKGPLKFQDHGNPVRFRNVWIREIPSRYVNTTHGGPGVKEADVMALRKETAAKLFADIDLKSDNKVDILRRMLEVISYDKDAKYMQLLEELGTMQMAKVAGYDKTKIADLKGEIMGIRNDLNVLIRNKVLPDDNKMRAELQKVIDEHKWK